MAGKTELTLEQRLIEAQAEAILRLVSMVIIGQSATYSEEEISGLSLLVTGANSALAYIKGL